MQPGEQLNMFTLWVYLSCLKLKCKTAQPKQGQGYLETDKFRPDV